MDCCNDITVSGGFMVTNAMMFFLATSVVANSWDFLMHSRGEDVGRVSLQQIDEGSPHQLHRRSSYFHHTHHQDGDVITNSLYQYPDDQDNNVINDNKFHDKNDDVFLPASLTFTFNFHGDDVILRLKKNKLLTESSIPVYYVHEGFIIKSDDVDHKKNAGLRFDRKPRYGLYHDPDLGASMMVTHGHRQGHSFHVTGTYFHDGQEFSIRPSMGKDDGTADHVISRLLQEANLLHDVIDLDQDTSFVATVTSSDNEDTGNKDLDGSNSETGWTNHNSNNNTTTTTTTNNNNNNNELDNPHVEFKAKARGENESNVDQSRGLNQQGLHGHDENSPVNIDDYKNRTIPGLISNQTKDDDDDLGDVRGDDNDDDVDDQKENDPNSRKKRQAGQSYVVELLIVIDYGVYETWFNGVTDREGSEKKEEAVRRIKQFYSFVINGVDLRYKSVSAHADYTVDVTWAGIIIFDTPDPTYWAETATPPKSSRDFVESSASLEAFRAWAERQGAALPPSDHVMLFTGHNLTYGGSMSNAGLAYLGSACNPDYFFSIVEEYFEFRDVAIAAHELGHSLGARHDMDGNTCLSFDRYIMTPRFKFPSLRKAKNPWLFSACSVSYFTDFIQGLDKNDTNCFVTKDAFYDDAEIQSFLVSLPGEVYSGDEFCKIGGGPDSYICREEYIKDYQSTCYRGLLCYDTEQKKCVSKLPPNGMTCGDKKWCVNGTCVQSNLAPATSDDGCPFGDTPKLFGGKTCAQRMLTSRSDCYRASFRAQCCESCQKFRRNLPGCEYGDQFELCRKEQCGNYEEEYARENCCDSCADLLFTIPTTVITTPAPTTTTTTTTTTTRTTTIDVDIVTLSKSGSKEEEKEGEGEGGGEGEGEERVFPNKRGKTKGEENWRKGRRRNYISSDESDDSDEYRPRGRYSATKTNFRQEIDGRRRYGYRRTTGRLVQIQSLLQAMKDARGNDRLQRLRLLIYLLDRTAQLGLADILLGPSDGGGQGGVNENTLGEERRDRDGEEYVDDEENDNHVAEEGSDGDNDDDDGDNSSSSGEHVR